MNVFCRTCYTRTEHRVTDTDMNKPAPHSPGNSKVDREGSIRPITIHATCIDCGYQGTYIGREDYGVARKSCCKP